MLGIASVVKADGFASVFKNVFKLSPALPAAIEKADGVALHFVSPLATEAQNLFLKFVILRYFLLPLKKISCNNESVFFCFCF